MEPNQDFHGLVCEGANMLPSKFLEDAFRDRHGNCGDHNCVSYPSQTVFLSFCCVTMWYLKLEFSVLQCAGKIINIRHLDQVIKSVNGWYQDRGLTGLVGNPNACFPGTFSFCLSFYGTWCYIMICLI